MCLRVTHTVLMVIFGGSLGCMPLEERDLIDNAVWQLVPADEDPFRDLWAAQADCNPLGITVEAGVLEIQTDVCAFATVKQTALARSRNGHRLDILAYHSALFSDPEATGYIAVQIGDTLVWEQTVAIPGDADVYANTFDMYPEIDEETPILFHVHNHGANSWKLAHVRLVPELAN